VVLGTPSTKNQPVNEFQSASQNFGTTNNKNEGDMESGVTGSPQRRLPTS